MNEEKVKPTLRMALLCDQVIEAKDGTVTIVRVIDKFQAIAMDRLFPDIQKFFFGIFAGFQRSISRR